MLICFALYVYVIFILISSLVSFKSFLQAFNDVIRDPKNKHLQHFYIIVPALTIQFVDDLIRSKEYKHKSTDSDRLVFTDDGFAMGLAYILIVLDQVDAFMTLDWFAAVRIKYEAELVDLEAKRSTLNSSFEDEKLKQTLMLTAKRIHTLSEVLIINLPSNVYIVNTYYSILLIAGVRNVTLQPAMCSSIFSLVDPIGFALPKYF